LLTSPALSNYPRGYAQVGQQTGLVRFATSGVVLAGALLPLRESAQHCLAGIGIASWCSGSLAPQAVGRFVAAFLQGMVDLQLVWLRELLTASWGRCNCASSVLGDFDPHQADVCFGLAY
jgi:hypothetical protein